MDGDEPEITAVARELYAVPPRDFVAHRTETAKGLAKPLAASVRALTKPTPAAWLVDRVSAEHGDELETAIALGAELQEAQGEADRVRIQRLSKQHRETVRALTAVARDIAAEASVSTSAAVLDEIAQTFSAAMADARAAQAVRSGLLIKSLQSTGLEPVELEGTLALPDLVPANVPANDAAHGAANDAAHEPAAEHEREGATPPSSRTTAATAERRAAAKREKAAEAARERERQRHRSEVKRRLARAEESVDRATRQLAEIEHARDHKTLELSAARDELAELQRQLDESV